MFKRTIFVTSIIFIFIFIGCQEYITNTESMKTEEKTLLKETFIPDTYVHGIVYKESQRVKGATVSLYKNGNFLTQTTSNDTGYYQICVCRLHQGYGEYNVRAIYIDKWGGTWSDSEYFTWVYGTWDYEVDLHLMAYK